MTTTTKLNLNNIVKYFLLLKFCSISFRMYKVVFQDMRILMSLSVFEEVMRRIALTTSKIHPILGLMAEDLKGCVSSSR